MKWIEHDNYHHSSGNWVIGVYINDEKVKYGLSYGNKHIGYFYNLDEAKLKAFKENKNV
jgi:hypothetical protein